LSAVGLLSLPFECGAEQMMVFGRNEGVRVGIPVRGRNFETRCDMKLPVRLAFRIGR
jgi:hypothetical protein